MSQNIGKNISKSLSSKYGEKRNDHAKTPATDALKTSWKRVIKRQRKQPVIWLATKLLINSQMFQKIHNKILQRQLQMSMIKK